ncbi:molybdopterin-guanine dinucleotide biosynthesis protein B [Afifella sp. IM 167]|uniref:molybdopterin-guanine dinucleotide biosynthesis protein B n=1 Tax=Afifella sp. IM 167 TaxID=2033586 RepID=UPI001CCEDBA9|nr:molybdopterin-guanine dinucleotide biosynthesis protein B [Afifella sp. IM 167]MBZ8134168.1 molybdopterin-guanine dinucleotide biosynthesis protein B [Afifella sp. IM 167]
MRPPVFGITGWKNSGKTTLVTRLVTEFSRRGLTVSTLKHAHHAFDIDHAGTDSFRHREAGAREVMLVSGKRWALMHELAEEEEEPAAEEMIDRLSACDLVLVEGYKRERHAKIEVRRRDGRPGQALALDDLTILAIASDHETETGGLPRFDLDDVVGIADFISDHLALPSRS